MKAVHLTPQPPYEFPRQRPSLESVDRDGDILIFGCFRGAWSFWYQKPLQLIDGDTWVPACAQFFRDWGNRAESSFEPSPASKRLYATSKWPVDRSRNRTISYQ